MQYPVDLQMMQHGGRKNPACVPAVAGRWVWDALHMTPSCRVDASASTGFPSRGCGGRNPGASDKSRRGRMPACHGLTGREGGGGEQASSSGGMRQDSHGRHAPAGGANDATPSSPSCLHPKKREDQAMPGTPGIPDPSPAAPPPGKGRGQADSPSKTWEREQLVPFQEPPLSSFHHGLGSSRGRICSQCSTIYL